MVGPEPRPRRGTFGSHDDHKRRSRRFPDSPVSPALPRAFGALKSGREDRNIDFVCLSSEKDTHRLADAQVGRSGMT